MSKHEPILLMTLLTPADAAAILHVSEKTLRKLRATGLRFVQIGHKVLYRSDDLNSYIEANTCHSAPKTAVTGTTTSKSGVVDFMARVKPKTTSKRNL